ncbi:hypothetical protein E7T06_06030 [Deinococcus sp. Arct2-2]|uniref:hypothetical protein n=1 Tax=Deinococcus sp. Arct2-2 TaxID=2568653 RepID=UPI0010A33920|nr:hypothetical protein [Deinococcus sp. Arct2-2]THF70695.1 hypothetical protein E7T06_06030 [Deinococcus sp. Arct2-2]
MLSNEERQRIEAEEVAAAEALAHSTSQVRHQEAVQAYRQEVRAQLRPRPAPWWWSLRWALAAVPVVAATLLLFPNLLPSDRATDDTAGGIANSALMNRCQAEVSGQLLQIQSDLAFPSWQEASGQFSANADGKRWDGWVRQGDTRTDFSCSFTLADQSVIAQLIQAN